MNPARKTLINGWSFALALAFLVSACDDSRQSGALDTESTETIAHLEESWLEISDQLIEKSHQHARLNHEVEQVHAELRSLSESIASQIDAHEGEIEKNEQRLADWNTAVRLDAERIKERMVRAESGEKVPPLACGMTPAMMPAPDSIETAKAEQPLRQKTIRQLKSLQGKIDEIAAGLTEQ